LVRSGAITQLKGIAKGLRIEGFGHVMWAINDSSGNLQMVKVPAYYAPMVRNRLFSTTSLLQTYTDKSIKIEPHQLVLSGVPGNLTRGELVALINPKINLPTSEANSFKDTPIAVKALNIAISTVNASNFNLSKLEKELLCWAHELPQNPIPHAHQHPEQVRSQPTPSHCILQDCHTSQVRSMPI
jgi:hypothetical protein